MAKNNPFEPDNGDYVSLIQKLNANSSVNKQLSKQEVKDRLDGMSETSSIFDKSNLTKSHISDLSSSIYSSDSQDHAKFSYEKIKQSYNDEIKDLTNNQSNFESINKNSYDQTKFGSSKFSSMNNVKSNIVDNNYAANASATIATKNSYSSKPNYGQNSNSKENNSSYASESLSSWQNQDRSIHTTIESVAPNSNASRTETFKRDVFYGNIPRNTDSVRRARSVNYDEESEQQEAMDALAQKGITYPKPTHTPFIAFGLFFLVVSYFGDLEDLIKIIATIAGSIGVVAGLSLFMVYRKAVRAYNDLLQEELQNIDSKKS